MVVGEKQQQQQPRRRQRRRHEGSDKRTTTLSSDVDKHAARRGAICPSSPGAPCARVRQWQTGGALAPPAPTTPQRALMITCFPLFCRFFKPSAAIARGHTPVLRQFPLIAWSAFGACATWVHWRRTGPSCAHNLTTRIGANLFFILLSLF
jgi:hypothetical protein